MQIDGYIISPQIDQLVDRVVDGVDHAVNVAVVGASGSGATSAGDILSRRLQEKGSHAVRLDCRSPGAWQDIFREACQIAEDLPPSPPGTLVLMVDHATDLPREQIAEIRNMAVQWEGKSNSAPPPAQSRGALAFLRSKARRLLARNTKREGDGRLRFTSQVWIGNIDCRSLEDKAGIRLASEPRFVLQMPEYSSEHLLSLYEAIGDRDESQWGEAILYTLLDWCGTDLALAQSLGAYFYGNWRNNIIYDDTVAECIGRWLKVDPLVEEYRQTLHGLPTASKALIHLLNAGGKIPSQAPFCNQEPNEHIRQLFMSGVISANLLPGFYQYRNLTMRLLALQSDPDVPPMDALDLLRKYSNGRIAAVLQDAEMSLRLLALRCFSRMGYDAVRDKLQKTPTQQQAVPTELRKALQDWAKTTGGPPRQQELGQFLTKYQKDFDSSRNLWTQICGLYISELGVAADPNIEPPLPKIVTYMTFGELADLLTSLSALVFHRWTDKEIGKDPPGKRWLAHMALLRRLRNQCAHLRNVAFQDIEDLLAAVREMRRDIEKYA